MIEHERWQDAPSFVATGDYRQDKVPLEQMAGELLTVSLASGTAGDVVTIDHGLGRVPRGMRIVNVVYDSTAANAETWYRINGDPNWTERSITVRFQFDDADVRVEVF